MNKIEESVFTEKYRPKTVKDVIGGAEKVEKYMDKPESIPNFLFYSNQAGTGKTSLAKAMMNDLGCDKLILNSSDDRKIETVREKVKEFSRSQSSNQKRKCVFLDEFDGMCLPLGTEIVTGTLKNTFIKKIEDVNHKKYVRIPSVNIKTGKLEDDFGILVDSGIADFFELELEDGRKIIASGNHPFFKKHFVETKLKDLKTGDEIIDMGDEIFNVCPICESYHLNSECCSVDCQNKLHSKKMMNDGNPMFNKKHSKTTKEKISKIHKGKSHKTDKQQIEQSQFMKKNNPMNNPDSRKKISEKLKGRILTQEHIEKVSKSLIDKYGLGTEKYEKYCEENGKTISFEHIRRVKKKAEERSCQICDIKLPTNNNSGIIIHHIDKNHKNNDPKNIAFVCSSCHNYIHKINVDNKDKKYLNWFLNNKENIIKNNIVIYSRGGNINEISQS